MKIAYIMRGVPGSGKSTVAKALAREDGAIHSTDDYFYKKGKYCFDAKMFGIYHMLNLKAFSKSVVERTPAVICDNTNTTKKEWEPYVKVAKASGYIVAFVTLPHPKSVVAARRNLHKVPADIIRKMINRWEQES